MFMVNDAISSQADAQTSSTGLKLDGVHVCGQVAPDCRLSAAVPQDDCRWPTTYQRHVREAAGRSAGKMARLPWRTFSREAWLLPAVHATVQR
eukprot:5868686-Pleurochrysis_carterae.AAC.2